MQRSGWDKKVDPASGDTKVHGHAPKASHPPQIDKSD
jgi:hypothetical protein